MRAYVLRSQGQVDRLLRIIAETWKAQVDAGRPLEVVVSEFMGRRSEIQNRRYWAHLRAIETQAVVRGRRYPAETWHEKYKRQIIGFEELPSGGMVGLSTSTLTAEEFDSYDRRVMADAALEHGVDFSRTEED
jgi:hypothetical protein